MMGMPLGISSYHQGWLTAALARGMAKHCSVGEHTGNVCLTEGGKGRGKWWGGAREGKKQEEGARQKEDGMQLAT